MSKGNVEKRGKNSYRLSYVYNSKLYRKTITASNMREARKEPVFSILFCLFSTRFDKLCNSIVV